jgi:hypothetical protein
MPRLKQTNRVIPNRNQESCSERALDNPLGNTVTMDTAKKAIDNLLAFAASPASAP